MENEQARFGPLKSVGSVLAGFAFVFVLSLGTDVLLHATGVLPSWFQPMSSGLWTFVLGYRLVYGIGGSYVTARIAPNRPMAPAMAGGVAGLILSIAGVIATWSKGPEFGPKW